MLFHPFPFFLNTKQLDPTSSHFPFPRPGHLYYFLRNVWPKMGHRELLLAPEWWCKILNRNNDDIIFRRDKRPLVGADGSTTGGDGGRGGGGLASMLPKKKSKIYKMKKTSS